MITIVNSPFYFTPSNNPSIYQIESDNPNIVYFAVNVIAVPSGAIIAKQKYFVRPDHQTGVSFNLSDILSNLVETKINNSPNVLASVIADATFSYRLTITEMINTSGVITSGTTYSNTNDKYTVWDADFDRLLFNTYNPFHWVTNVNYQIKFLSLKNQISKQSGTSAEHLYFLNKDNLAKTVRIRTYGFDGVQLDLFTASLPTGNMVRLNVSPKTIYNLYSNDWALVGHYRVDILNASGVLVSEEKVYKYFNDACYLQPVNILFTNSLGGLESFVFHNPKESISVTKTTLKSNPLQLNNGLYSDNVNGILNQTEKILNVNSISTYTVFSDILSDDEFVMLHELIASKNVYVELSDNETLIPITIKNTNYDILLRRFNGNKLNRLEIQYTAQSGFIPSKSALFGTGLGSAQIQFLDMPVPPQTSNGVVYIDSSNGNITI